MFFHNKNYYWLFLLILLVSLPIVLLALRKPQTINQHAAGIACTGSVIFITGVNLTTQGSSFMYNGQPICLYGATIYTSSGTNAPNYNWTNTNFPQRIDWDLQQAQAAHLNIIRPTDEINSDSNPEDPIVWQNMDYLVQQAEAKHMFVLMDLSTFGHYLEKQGLNPYDPAVLPQWKTFIDFIVNRYKSYPNISNYKVMGEVNPPGSSLQPQTTAQGYIDFFNTTTTYIYNDDPTHLIAAGGLTHLNGSTTIPWQQIFSLPHVNMSSIHVYSANRLDPINGSNDLNQTVPMVSSWSLQADPTSGRPKPLQIEEYGIAQQNGDQERATDMQIIQQRAIQYGYTNLIQWNLGPEQVTLDPLPLATTFNYDVGPQTPLAWQQLVAGSQVFYGSSVISPTTMPTSTPVPQNNFVTVCGTILCFHGNKFVVKGATAYGQYANATNEVTLAKQANLTVLELVEFDTQYHTLSDTESAATWSRVDNFIAAARQGGLHVILNLSEYGQSLAANGQTPTTADWGPYLSFIANRVNTVTGIKYADDPTIAMVELYGEIDAPNYGKSTAGTTAQMNAFFQRTLAEWKSLAPNILISSGGFSYLNDANSGIDWKTIMSDPNNATCDVEINSYPDRNTTIPMVSSYCQSIGKPWFLAAWSSCNNTSTWGADDINDWPTDSAMAAHAQDMYNVSTDNNPTAPGPSMTALGNDFWNLASVPVQNGSCDIGPQYPLTFQTVQNNMISPSTTPLPTVTTVPTNTPVLNSTILSLPSILLHGIGKAGDSISPGSTGNLTPMHPSRTVSVSLYNGSAQLITTKTGTITYQASTGDFKGNVDLGTGFSSGTYTVKVSVPQYLVSQVVGFYAVTQGQSVSLPQFSMVVGDANGDNQLDILDYNMLLGCYSDLAPATNCPGNNKQLTDFSDDGLVNQTDYNLFLRELSVRTGQ